MAAESIFPKTPWAVQPSAAHTQPDIRKQLASDSTCVRRLGLAVQTRRMHNHASRPVRSSLRQLVRGYARAGHDAGPPSIPRRSFVCRRVGGQHPCRAESAEAVGQHARLVDIRPRRLPGRPSPPPQRLSVPVLRRRPDAPTGSVAMVLCNRYRIPRYCWLSVAMVLWSFAPATTACQCPVPTQRMVPPVAVSDASEPAMEKGASGG